MSFVGAQGGSVDMQSDNPWTLVNAFADWVHTRPLAAGSFDAWWESYWPEHRQKCFDVARHIYVSRRAAQIYTNLLTETMTWEESMAQPALRQALVELHAEVQIDPGFFFEVVMPSFRDRCQAIFNNARQALPINTA